MARRKIKCCWITRIGVIALVLVIAMFITNALWQHYGTRGIPTAFRHGWVTPVWLRVGFLWGFVGTIGVLLCGSFYDAFRLGRLKKRPPGADGLCPECDYDLRGAPAGGCPECGWRRPTAGDA